MNALPTLRNHHVRRIELVSNHIEEHLPEDLTLNTLASLAAISPFHFHRLFQAWSGETLKEFVRRRRLESAAGRLRHCPDEKVTAISLNCGFASPEAFARAFRDHFGMAPSQWRSGGWRRRTAANDGAHGGHDTHANGSRMPRVQVRRHEEAEFLYLRAQGDYALTAASLWARFLPWVHSLGLGEQPLLFIGLDDPDITPAAQCRMDACVQLPPGWNDPGLRLARRRLPARWVATLRHDGPSHDIGHSWHQLLGGWLPDAAFCMGEGHFYERYDPTESLPGHERVRCELCMPVSPRMN